jgi:hypothetical protein
MNKQLLAANPATNPKLLTELSRDQDPVVLRRVAGNPNTPINVLWQLVTAYPYEVADNPLLALVILEKPNWITEISIDDWMKFLDQSDVPEVFSRAATQHPNYAIRIAAIKTSINNNKTSTEYLEEITLEGGVLYKEVFQHPNITLNSLYKFADCIYMSVQMEIGKHCLNYAQSFSNNLGLSQSDIDKIIEVIIQNVVKSNKHEAKLFMLQQTKIPTKHIAVLLQDLPPKLQLKLAKTKSISIQVLEKLFAGLDCLNSWQVSMWQAAAGNPITPMSMLYELTNSEHKSIRLALATRVTFSESLLVKLLADSYPEIKKNLLNNINISSDILANLSQHNRLEIRDFVQQHHHKHNYLVSKKGAAMSMKTVFV